MPAACNEHERYGVQCHTCQRRSGNEHERGDTECSVMSAFRISLLAHSVTDDLLKSFSSMILQ